MLLGLIVFGVVFGIMSLVKALGAKTVRFTFRMG
jgi:hypothetical protein